MIRLVLLFLIILPCSVFANDRVAYLKAIMPNMIDFITDVSDYEYKGYPYPDIVIDNAKDICEGAYMREIDDVDNCDIAGYYNDDTNTIHIRNEPTRYMTDDRFQEVILLHELVHFLQKFSGTYEEVECKQNLEEDAYTIQELYIDLMGIDPKQKPDPLFAIVSSLCPNKYPLFFNEEQ